MDELTAEKLRELLAYDPETGVFTRRVARGSTFKVGDIAGGPTAGYTAIRIGPKLYYAHRLAWLYMTGDWPAKHIDHINLIRTDNRWCNLRDVSRRVNQENRSRAQTNNSTGLLGAFKNHNGFIARITVKGEDKYLGSFKTADLAHAAYVEAKRNLHEGCTI